MSFLKRTLASPVLFVRLASMCILLMGMAFLFACSWITISGPQGQWVTSEPFTPPSSLPQTDIVYQRDEELGFVNADGLDVTTVPFRIPMKTLLSYWGLPFITGDNQTLVVTDHPYPPIGNIYVVRPGQVAVDCEWWGIARLAADGRHILLETSQGQEKYLPEDCGTGNPPEKIYKDIFGPLSPDERLAAEVRAGSQQGTVSLFIRDIETGEGRVIGEGRFPAWSRDGGWLAYTGPDGIYVVRNSPDAQPRRLVALEILHPEIGGKVYIDNPSVLYYPTMASWSPDGKWLAYHEYHSDPVDPSAQFAAKYYSIVKVNVETGETIKLLDGGFFPSWRWPAEEP
ncbi:MAG: PD40 domain-containing protein [Anaerolineales bacterium]|nr:PD40 domain-containing protein [Anaerolineales bacterium]